MTKPFSLQTVLELMQVRSDEATLQLARLIASERDAKTKLDLLRNYRDDYAHRFRSAAQNGIGQREWHNFQEFLNRLDEAIELQAQAVAQHERHTALGQRNGQEPRKKLRAFDTLAERHARREAQREQKSEQKQQDEIAARRRREDS